MIEIKCTQAVYERLIDAAQTYFDTNTNKCFLGKTLGSCPMVQRKEPNCESCLRNRIKRI